MDDKSIAFSSMNINLYLLALIIFFLLKLIIEIYYKEFFFVLKVKK